MSLGASFLFRVGGLVIDADTPLDGLQRLEEPEATDVAHAWAIVGPPRCGAPIRLATVGPA